jgi:hypothetical protein
MGGESVNILPVSAGQLLHLDTITVTQEGSQSHYKGPALFRTTEHTTWTRTTTILHIPYHLLAFVSQ